MANPKTAASALVKRRLARPRLCRLVGFGLSITAGRSSKEDPLRTRPIQTSENGSVGRGVMGDAEVTRAPPDDEGQPRPPAAAAPTISTATEPKEPRSSLPTRAFLLLSCVGVCSGVLACALLVAHHLHVAPPPPKQQWGASSADMGGGGSFGPGPCNEAVDVPLWPAGGVPLAHANMYAPRLAAYVPQGNASAASAAVVIAPGSSYVGLADHVEGHPYARWLCAQGIASYVLFYRCGGMGYYAPAPETDAKRAVRTVRSRHEDWQKVGIIGSSAGGHLAATVLAYNDKGDASAADPIDRLSSRPAFGVLAYPVITMEDNVTHVLSKQMLLGPNITQEEEQALSWHYSIEKHVRLGFPPTFLFVAEDDEEVPVENTLRMARALTAAKIPHELALYQHGGHGLGLGRASNLTAEGELLNGHPWAARMLKFIGRQVDGRA